MASSNLTQEMKRNSVALTTNHSDLGIVSLLKVANSFSFKVRNEQEASAGVDCLYPKKETFWMVKGPKNSNCCLSDPTNEYCCQVAQSDSPLLKHGVYKDIRYKSYIYEERAIHVWKDLEKVSPNWSICWTGSNILRSLKCSGRISTSIGRYKGGMTGGSVLVMSP